MKEQYSNPMVRKALEALQALSADEKTRELAERREKALRDEAMFLNEANKKGREEGRKEGIIEGRQEGITEAKKLTAARLIQKKLLTDEQIAEVVDLDIQEIRKLKQAINEQS